MQNKDWQKLTIKELKNKAEALRKDLITLKLSRFHRPEKNVHLYARKRHELAYLLTLVRQKEIAGE